MDTTQLAQQVSWLDEQRRRDRNELVSLQQRIETQNAQIMELGKKLQETEGRLASVSAQLTRFTLVDQTLEQFKEEVTLMLRREEEQRQLAEREAAHLRHTEREAMMKSLNELRQQLRPIPKLHDELEIRKAEDKRLSDSILELRQHVIDVSHQGEDWPKRISFLEEQHRLLNKRAAQMEQSIAETLKALEQIRGRYELADGAISRLDSRMNTLWGMRDEMRAEFRRLQEATLLSDQERDARVKAQLEKFDEFSQQMESFEKGYHEFEELFADNRRYLSSIQQLEEQLKRDQNQVAELQRLAEERVQKSFEEFSAENERRWRQHEMTWDQRWNEQERTNARLEERFKPLEERVKTFAVQLTELWDVLQAFTRHYSAEAERWLAEFTKRWDERTR